MSAAPRTLVSSLILPTLLLCGAPNLSLAATYFVDAKTGDDGGTPSTATSPETPWATLTRALSEGSLAPGDIIRVAPGTYTAAGGETFPLTLKEGVSIIGPSAEEVNISGVGVPDLQNLLIGGEGLSVVHLEGLSFGGAEFGLTLAGLGSQADITLRGLNFEELQGGVNIDVNAEVSSLGIEVVDNDFVDLISGLNISSEASIGLELDGTFQENSFQGGEGISLALAGNTAAVTLNLNTQGNTYAGVSSGFSLQASAPQGDLNLLGFMVGDAYIAPTSVPLSFVVEGGDGASDITLTTLLDIQNSTFSGLGAEGVRYEISSPNIATLNQILTLDGNGFAGAGDGIVHTIEGINGGALTPQVIITDNDFSELAHGVGYNVTDLVGGSFDGLFSVAGNTFVAMDLEGVGALFQGLRDMEKVIQTIDIDGNSFLEPHSAAITSSLQALSGHNIINIQENVTGNTFEDVGGDFAISFGASDLSENEELRIATHNLGNSFTNLGGGGIEDNRDDISANGLVFLGNDTSENTTSEGAETLLDLGWGGMSNNTDLETRIRAIDNDTSEVLGSVVRIAQSTMDGNLATRGQVVVAGNQVSGGDVGADIDLQGIEDTLVALFDIDVVNNTFDEIGAYGAQLSVSSLSNIDDGQLNTLIAGNNITEPGSMGVLFSNHSFDVNAMDHRLTMGGNSISAAADDAIHISTDGLTRVNSVDVLIEDNTLTASGRDGLSLVHHDPPGTTFTSVSGNTFGSNLRYGAYLAVTSLSKADFDAPWDLGGGALGSPGRNSFLENGEYAILSDSFHTSDISAQSNYWGTTNLQEIEAEVFDNRDISEQEEPISLISVLTPLDAAPGEPVVSGEITSEVIEDAGLPGPSPGDVIRYTATLTGTGDVGCRGGMLLVPAPTGGAFVKDASSASLGVVAYADVRGLKAYTGYIPTGRSITVTWDVSIFDGGACAGLGPVNAVASCEAIPELAIEGAAVDLSSETFGRDSDEDGYGDGGDTQASCYEGEAFEGYVQNTGDCDDSEAAINPEASEACDELDNDCDGEVDEGEALGSVAFPIDGDLDGYGDSEGGVSAPACAPPEGYAELEGDCDDDDADIFPGAEETCDEVDQDCDGEVDEGAGVQSYPDADGDGYGVTLGSEVQCPGAAGYAEEDGDCDDRTPLTYPGAEEICDGKDNDCDRDIDEGLEQTYYLDSDRDGFGNPEVSDTTCAPPNGYVTNGEDCNDNTPASYPGAEEVCDIADNDCDGDIDEGVTTTYYIDADGDGQGSQSETIEACDVPLGYATGSEDCDDSEGAAYLGAEEVCDQIDNNCDGAVDEGGVCPESPTPDQIDVEGGGGCSCDTSQKPGSAAGMALLLLGLGALRRRTRA